MNRLDLWTPLHDDVFRMSAPRAQERIRDATGERHLYLALDPPRENWVLFYAPNGNPSHEAAGVVCREPVTSREPDVETMVAAVVAGDRSRRGNKNPMRLREQAKADRHDRALNDDAAAIADDLYDRTRLFLKENTI